MDEGRVRAAPVAASERIQVLDVLRGVAILGILVVNIQVFSMIDAVYMNPTVGDLSGVNWWIWSLSFLFFRTKFITLFSMMFGAGIVLMTSRAEAKGIGSAAVHYRRTLVLLVIGVLHAFLLWSGDILLWYSMCALIAFPFRKVRPKRLLIVGIIGLVIPSLLFVLFKWSMPYWPEESYEMMVAHWNPSAEEIANEIAAFQGGWLAQMEYRVPTAIRSNTFGFLVWGLWRSTGLMLIGMALFKWGVLTARRSRRFYLTLVAVGAGVGFPLEFVGIAANFAADWNIEYSMFTGSQFNYWASVLIALAYIGVIMLVFGSPRRDWLTEAIAAVGRTAFTNYLMQTIICTTIFHGHGLGLFGEVGRAGQLLVVMAVWAVQLTASSLWLRHFAFGPFEWVWRSLTYMKPQPMRRASTISQEAPIA